MKKTLKKHLATILLLFTLVLPYASASLDIDCGSLVSPKTDAETASCCSDPEEPEEKPVIINPSHSYFD